MAASRKRKAPAGSPRRRTARKKKSTGVGKVVSWFLTAVFFLFSLGMLGYVVFFRTVQAQEVKDAAPEYHQSVVFEEPDPPIHEHDGEVLSTSGDKPKIAIIIDDMGYHHHEGEALLALPYELTFSFLPYAPFTTEAMETAYQQGKTILLHQPMQPKGVEWNPGEGALLVDQSQKEIEQLLATNLQRVQYATGVNNHMGSLFTEHNGPMTAVLQYIQDNNLFFVDSFTTSKSVGYTIAKDQGMKTARRHVFLDNKQDVQSICNQLEKLVVFAEKNGEGIGIGHPYPQTYEALKRCLPSQVERVMLVGVEKLVH